MRRLCKSNSSRNTGQVTILQINIVGECNRAEYILYQGAYQDKTKFYFITLNLLNKAVENNYEVTSLNGRMNRPIT